MINQIKVVIKIEKYNKGIINKKKINKLTKE